MIRQLNEGDRRVATRLLSEAPQLNLYMLSNLITPGFTADFCRFWGDVRNGDLVGVVNLYMTGWSVYGRPDADWDGLARVIDDYRQAGERLQDNPGGVASILPYLRCYRATWVGEEQLMALDKGDFQAQSVPPEADVRRATWDDLSDLVNFYAGAEEMSRSQAAVERPLRDRRIWVARIGGEIAAAALTNAEVAGAAMIGGVYTRRSLRGRGLGQAVCSALCAELLAEGCTPHLYWENPAAGAIYRKLGFHPVGVWRSVRIARTDSRAAGADVCVAR